MRKGKRIRMPHILGAIFIAFVVYVGAATIPETFAHISEFAKGAGISGTAEKIDDDYRDMLGFKSYNLQNKGFYINLNGLAARAMGQRFMNNVVKLENGHLTLMGEEADDAVLSAAASQITKLYGAQKGRGKEFVFVMTPNQIPKNADVVPKGYKDYSNQNADKLIEMLAANGVPVIDLREELIKDGIDNSDAYFVTDHHWKPETAFWAYTRIVDYFAGNGVIGEVPAEYTDLSCYDIDVYEDWFLGSNGKRTGSYYAGVDDFSQIIPKFEAEISIEIPRIGLYKQGDFAEVAYDGSNLVLDYYIASMYSAYGYGERDRKFWRNENAASDLRVLAIGDSNLNAPSVFFPLVFSEYDQLDMRMYKEDFKEYYSGYDPDVVILLIAPSSIDTKNVNYDFLG